MPKKLGWFDPENAKKSGIVHLWSAPDGTKAITHMTSEGSPQPPGAVPMGEVYDFLENRFVIPQEDVEIVVEELVSCIMCKELMIGRENMPIGDQVCTNCDVKQPVGAV